MRQLIFISAIFLSVLTSVVALGRIDSVDVTIDGVVSGSDIVTDSNARLTNGTPPPPPAPSATLPTALVLNADVDITATSTELVTFGLPFSEGAVTSTDEIRVTINDVEVPIYVETGMTYHYGDGSIRSATIQLQNVDMTNGDVVIVVSDSGRVTANDLTEQPHSNGWATAGADKGSKQYPRIFALHDTTYLSESSLIPQYAPSTGAADPFEIYQTTQFAWSGSLDYPNSTRGNWLFDRSSANFKAYMSTGKVEFLKEAFLAKQFYFTYVRNDGSPLAAPGGDGCFEFETANCADPKYIAPQQAKLAWALVGDDSQWDTDLIIDMALQADVGWYQHNTRDAWDEENAGFTERAAGLVGLTEIVVYEMTGDATVLSHLNERIAVLKDMQQTEKTWDVINGWTPKSGSFQHNLEVHEGSYSPTSAPTGVTDDRGFSPWMSENIADMLWQTYWITAHADIPEMLRLLAGAVEEYSFTTRYNAGSYSFRTSFSGDRTHGCSTGGSATDLLYFGSAYASDAQVSGSDYWLWYTDQHNIETVFTLGVGYYFETDATTRTKLASRINSMIGGWVNTTCAAVSSTPRLWNWQHRSNSVRTWEWIEGI